MDERWRPTEDSTVEEFVAWWLAVHIEPRYSAMTLQTYSSALGRHALPRFGARPIGEIDLLDIQAWVDDLAAEGYSPASIGLFVRALASAFKFGVGLRLLGFNPVSGVRLPALRAQGRRALEPEEVRALRAAWAGEWYAALLDTAIGTGMRRGELLALTWDRVGESEIVIDQGAKGETVRTVPISQSLRTILGEHQSRIRVAAARAGTRGWASLDLCFPTRAGTPGSKSGIASTLRRAAKAAGISPPPVLHELRHTYATLLIDGGVPRSQLRRLLGHRYYQTTMQYVHASDAVRRTAGDVIDGLLDT